MSLNTNSTHRFGREAFRRTYYLLKVIVGDWYGGVRTIEPESHTVPVRSTVRSTERTECRNVYTRYFRVKLAFCDSAA